MRQEKIILLVEDNADDEALALRALKKYNVANRVDVVRDGVEAIEYLFNEENDLPQLVLLDLKLPKLDGLEVLERIRKHERTALLPVTVLTTSKQESDMLESYKRGANSFIHKPVDFEQFTEAIRQLGLYWLVLNEGPYVKNF